MSTRAVAPSARCLAVKPFRPLVVEVRAERLKLGNLSPPAGAKRDKARKGRGYGAGQGGTCGFGNRGQKCRSGPSVRTGFEGGQMPLYRRMPKLRGIAGGMGKGEPDFVVVNLKEIAQRYEAGEEVTIDNLKEKGVLRASGKRAKLPLKVLGTGELKGAVTIKAAAFSESAKTKIEAAGAKAELVPQKPKWTRVAHKKMVEALKAEGKDYKEIKLAKRVEALKRKNMVNKKRLQPKKVKAAAPAKGKKN
eukprot:CAMPEP_0202857306 /NCGR_PEP_ID=MMETSP1391-20130828/307_1 /ASSEMBLY_ACC=CAM_ASM_000867 /TAXON_ID=1034604 /ORGANISM="Chlamydomonas leiostraca, Strain SAG 11-49" /LENGTH=248 /DNA_ID=CAMNT_0049536095 /DNA_START=37 /DNA_END=783 /DNA_ORIENTATION=+